MGVSNFMRKTFKMGVSNFMRKTFKIVYLSSCMSFIFGAVAVYCTITFLTASKEKRLVNSAYRMVETNSHDADARAWLGFCLYQQKSYSDALNAYHKAISIDSRCVAAYIGIATYYVEVKKNDDEAFNWIKKGLMHTNKETTEQLLKVLFNKKLCKQCQESLGLLRKDSK